MKKESITPKIKKFFNWIWQECKGRNTLLLFIAVVVVMYLPVWGGYLLHANSDGHGALPSPLLTCCSGRDRSRRFSRMYGNHAVEQKGAMDKIPKATREIR